MLVVLSIIKKKGTKEGKYSAATRTQKENEKTSNSLRRVRRTGISYKA